MRAIWIKQGSTTARINLKIGLEQMAEGGLNFEDQPWCCGVGGSTCTFKVGEGKLDSVLSFISFLFFFPLKFLW